MLWQPHIHTILCLLCLTLKVISLRLYLSHNHNAHKLHLPEFSFKRPYLGHHHNAHNLHEPELINIRKRMACYGSHKHHMLTNTSIESVILPLSFTISVRLFLRNDHNAHKLHLPEF